MLKTIKLFVFMTFFAISDPIWAQEGSRLFIWDYGQEPGQIDSGDYVMDLSKQCLDAGNIINDPEFPIPRRDLPEAHPIIGDEAFGVFARIIGGNTPMREMFETISVLDYYKGFTGTTFLLMPEIHKATGGVEQKKRHIELNVARTLFAAGMAAIAGPRGGALNLSEGDHKIDLERYRVKVDRSASLIDQLKQAFTTGVPGTFEAIFNVFDPPAVYSSFIDIRSAQAGHDLLLFGFDGSQSFEEMQTKLLEEGRNYDPNILRGHYDEFKKMTRGELNYQAIKICDERSFYMVDTAMTLIEQKKPTIVLFRYGAAHHEEITEMLRMVNFSYITIMPRIMKRAQ